MDINLVKNVINCVNFVNIGRFWLKWSKLGHFGAKMTSYVKISGKKSNNFSLRVSKNYFSQVYGKKFGQKCHQCGQFCQNRSFLGEMVEIGSFWGQNDVLCQNLGKVVKYFFHKSS